MEQLNTGNELEPAVNELSFGLLTCGDEAGALEQPLQQLEALAKTAGPRHPRIEAACQHVLKARAKSAPTDSTAAQSSATNQETTSATSLGTNQEQTMA